LPEVGDPELTRRRVAENDGIDGEVIADLTRRIQAKFDEHPIWLDVRAGDDKVVRPGTTTIYNGPVFHGDASRAQLAWGNHKVSQTAANRTDVAPGFEALAKAVVLTLEGLGAARLSDEALQDAEAAGNEVLAEVSRPEPDQGVIRRSLSALMGILAPIAVGISTGSAEGAAQEWAKTAIEQLGTAF
jgi:hypothetical protein